MKIMHGVVEILQKPLVWSITVQSLVPLRQTLLCGTLERAYLPALSGDHIAISATQWAYARAK